MDPTLSPSWPWCAWRNHPKARKMTPLPSLPPHDFARHMRQGPGAPCPLLMRFPGGGRPRGAALM
jgi:hypothetical protein